MPGIVDEALFSWELYEDKPPSDIDAMCLIPHKMVDEKHQYSLVKCHVVQKFGDCGLCWA
jgi:hypothetical protein